MDSTKRKKSGNEFRRDKKAKELQESAKTCSKITTFYVKPNSSCNHPDIEIESSEEITNNIESTSTTTLPAPKTDSIFINDVMCTLESSHEKTPSMSSTLPEQALPEPASTSLLVEGVSVKGAVFSEQKKDYFKKPSEIDLSDYFSFHPYQPKNE